MEHRNQRMPSESYKAYKDRQKLMKLHLKHKKRGRVVIPMAASRRRTVQRGAIPFRTHHDPDKNYGSLSAHKRWAAQRCNRLSKIAKVEAGMAKLRKSFNINVENM